MWFSAMLKWTVILFIVWNGETFTLDLEGPPSSSSHPVMVRGFLCLPQGAVYDASRYRVLDGKGAACPADRMVTARWADGSIRYLALKAMVQGRQATKKLRLKEMTAVRGSLSLIECKGDPTVQGELTVNTGPIEVSFSRTDPGLVSGMTAGGRAVLVEGRALGLSVHLNGTEFRSVPPRQVLLNRGEAETKVLVMGRTRSKLSGELGPEYEMRFFFHPGSPVVQSRLRITGEGLEGYSEGVFLEMPLAFGGRRPRIRLDLGSEGHKVSLDGGKEIKLYALNSRVVLFNGKEEETLPALQSASMIMDAGGLSLCLSLPRFRALHPWSIEIRPPGFIQLSLFSKAFEWYPGLHCDREFILYPKKGGAITRRISNGPELARAAAFGLARKREDRPIPFAPAARGLASDPLYSLYMEVTESLLNRLKKEWYVWDGYRNFGDYRTRWGQFANCEFDPAYGLIKRFIISGKADNLACAEVMLKHWLRFDRTGPADPGFPAGVPWGHDEDHCSGWIEPGHMWVEGTLLFGLMTGEREYLDAASAIGRYLAGIRMDLRTGVNERSVSWSLINLAALHESGLTGFKEPMNRLAALIRSRQTRAGYFRFSSKKDQDASGLFVNSWVTSGITMEALYRHFLLTSDGYTLESLIGAAKWLTSACRDRATREWYQRIGYSKADERIILERTGIVNGEEAAFLALGLARAGHLAERAGWMALARNLLEKSLKDLKKRPARLPGKALAMISRAAPEVILITRGDRDHRR